MMLKKYFFLICYFGDNFSVDLQGKEILNLKLDNWNMQYRFSLPPSLLGKGVILPPLYSEMRYKDYSDYILNYLEEVATFFSDERITIDDLLTGEIQKRRCAYATVQGNGSYVTFLLFLLNNPEVKQYLFRFKEPDNPDSPMIWVNNTLTLCTQKIKEQLRAYARTEVRLLE